MIIGSRQRIKGTTDNQAIEISIEGRASWNSLTSEVRSADSLPAFRRKINAYF